MDVPRSLAVAAAAMIEAEIGDTDAVERIGKGDLLGRSAVGQQAVAADDNSRFMGIRKMQGSDQLIAIGHERNDVLGGHKSRILFNIESVRPIT